MRGSLSGRDTVLDDGGDGVRLNQPAASAALLSFSSSQLLCI